MINLVITGGGTAGHVYPAIAIARHFMKKDPTTNVIYIGAKGGAEEKIVPREGFAFETIEVKGFKRKITPENIVRAFMAANSLRKCRKILKKNNVNLVIGTGGYVSGPVCLVAQMMGIKTAIHEQNYAPGMTNKILSRRADFVFCGFKQTVEKFPSNNAVYTGNPVSVHEHVSSKKEAREKLEFKEDEKIVLIMGGSGGSPLINDGIIEIAEELEKEGIKIVLSTGTDYYEEFKEEIEKKELTNLRYFPYIYDVDEYIQSADIAVSSAGAGSLAQLNYYKKPIVAIPKAHTAENHQEFNAMMIEENGAGVCLIEKDLNGKNLLEIIKKAFEDENRLEEMGENSGLLYNKDTLDIIYDKIMGVMDV